MRVKFVKAPTGGRDHKVGDVVDVPHDYAHKYIAKGWAEEHKEELPKPAGVQAKEATTVQVHRHLVGYQATSGDKLSGIVAAVAGKK